MTPEIQQLLREWPLGNDLALDEDSVCVLAGMYKGRVAELLYSAYGCKRIIGFDAQLWALKEAHEREERLGTKWEIYPYLIGDRTEANITMHEWGTDGCSTVAQTRETGTAQMYEIKRAFDAAKIGHVDFLLFNAEGAEYYLLPHMVEQDMMKDIDKIAVQFHIGLGNAIPREEIDALMEQTHTCAYDDFPRWLYWVRRS